MFVVHTTIVSQHTLGTTEAGFMGCPLPQQLSRPAGKLPW